MNLYERADFKLTEFDVEDVITTSGGGDGGGSGSDFHWGPEDSLPFPWL